MLLHLVSQRHGRPSLRMARTVLCTASEPFMLLAACIVMLCRQISQAWGKFHSIQSVKVIITICIARRQRMIGTPVECGMQ